MQNSCKRENHYKIVYMAFTGVRLVVIFFPPLPFGITSLPLLKQREHYFQGFTYIFKQND